MTKENIFYDIHILKTTGIPLFAGCTVTEYCKHHKDQHILQSGFIAAIHAFSRESFSKSVLRKLIYNDVKVSFKSDHEMIMVFVHPFDHDVQDDLNRAWDRFKEKFKEELKSQVVNKMIFDSFEDELRELGIVTDELHSIIPAQEIDEVKQKKTHPRLLKWLKLKKEP
ncbi:MAG: hypothetical protein ACXAC7_16405 [Candidatus Hodarchaeales archaeon]